MFIDKIFPAVVAKKDTLLDRLQAEATAFGLTEEQSNAIFLTVPKPLINAGAFLDKMTGIWRYEYGIPFDIADKLIWGTHMWTPVDSLFSAILSANTRLPVPIRTTYLQRLADPDAHQATLVEMIPAHKVSADIPMKFEVAGLGAGNRTVDWVIGPHYDRTVLLDVKRRTTDFIQQAEQMNVNETDQQPNHDPALLFRSVEHKFIEADPNMQLQGVWILTSIKQDESKLRKSFEALDENKVHFAILGDWKPDAYFIVSREQDRQYLVELFNAVLSKRFTFNNDG